MNKKMTQSYHILATCAYSDIWFSDPVQQQLAVNCAGDKNGGALESKCGNLTIYVAGHKHAKQEQKRRQVRLLSRKPIK